MTGGPAFAVFCVNYRSEADAVSLAEEMLAQQTAARVSVVVVDNQSEPGGLAGLPAGAEVIEPGGNVGYFGALAAAVQGFTDREGRPDWVILTNADITIGDAGFLQAVLDRHGASPPAVIAPAIISQQFGHDQNPHFAVRPSRHRMRLYRFLFRRYWLNVAYQGLSLVAARLGRGARRALTGGPGDPGIQDIYAPHGAFIIIHRTYFDAGGDLLHGSFLFGEEIHVAEAARRLGLRIVHDPGLRVLHREHSTMGSFSDRVIARHRGDAADYLVRRFFS